MGMAYLEGRLMRKSTPNQGISVEAPESIVTSDSPGRYDYAPHLWQSLDNINRELGRLSQGVDNIGQDHTKIFSEIGKISSKIELFGNELAETKKP